ncbi:MAG: amidase domain-containing protein [Clostridiaceae bacterium]|nr:amidase domain-containing protein [Clostridiaceae bacterium]
MLVVNYNRNKAVEYAHKWALDRNPRYYDFEKIGGDCTNFASQVLYAGSNVMNYTPNTGWYYININNRSPSWTGVDFLYRFLVNNTSAGPFAEEVEIKDIQPGDIIQLSFDSPAIYNHSLVVVKTGIVPDEKNILIATHSIDRDNYPLSSYQWQSIRYIHIKGVRKFLQ